MQPESALKRAILAGTFSFTARPEPIAGDLRMSWGIGILLLSLLKCHGKKASFQKLQFLAHSVRLPEGREDVRAFLRGELRSSDLSVRLEPWLNRAVALAHALGLVLVSKGKSVSLTEEGKGIANTIDLDESVFADENEFLSQIAPRLTERILTMIWRMEDVA